MLEKGIATPSSLLHRGSQIVWSQDVFTLLKIITDTEGLWLICVDLC